ncbi:phospholipid carrier-dependent glycosyltransferase [Aureispira anguillae]|uniref:Glycosyltransferase family 39 protein n=1 Tax=Aureispira anguillae TaxID=2864201 RepID=A0A915YDT5_9BACT|nr:glycosyltransferase family 39 protein [Aureispira anguillae]BDS11191.1 glycosyltransferase family 39 protein [Aureispira anguillae]
MSKNNPLTQSETSSSHSNLPKFVFGILLILASIFILSSSLGIGLPSDEPIDHAYGKTCLNYYKSFGQDTSFVDLKVYGQPYKNQKYYGAIFEATAAAVTASCSPATQYHIRHFLVAICGILIILFTGLTAKELSGWKAAAVTTLLMMASPTIVGQMLFNSKDIPFALGFAITCYYTVRFARNYPQFKRGDAIGLGLGIAIAVGTRVGGFLLATYPFIFFGLKLIFEKEFRTVFFSHERSQQIKLILLPAAVIILGCLLGLLFYPNFWMHPVSHVSDALNVAVKFPVSITLFFEGDMVRSTNLPPNYLLKSLQISLPLFTLLSIPLILSLFFKSKFISKTHLLFFLFTTLFPICFVIYTKQTIYNGWRHITFFYPSFVILAGLAISSVVFPFRKSVAQWLAVLIFGGLILKTLIWQLTYPSYQYAYYNELAGGFHEAYDEFDNDYQQLAVTKGVYWLLENEPIFKDKNRTKKIKIASNNAHALNMYFDAKALNVEFVKTGIKSWKSTEWDYSVMSTIFLPRKIRDLVFPPKDLLYAEEIEGRGIAYVVKQTDRTFYKGLMAMQAKKYDEAYQLFLDAYAKDPSNFNIWLSLAHIYSISKKGDETIQYAKPYLELYPADWIANQLLGLGYLHKKDFTNSEKFLVRAIRINPKQKSAYYNLIHLYEISGQQAQAQKIRQQLAALK